MRGERVGLEPAERAQAELGELVLELADVVLSHGEVVEQVARGGPVVCRHRCERIRVLALERERGVAESLDLPGQRVDPLGGVSFGHRRSVETASWTRPHRRSTSAILHADGSGAGGVNSLRAIQSPHGAMIDLRGLQRARAP